MASNEAQHAAAEHRANVATGWSMLASLVIVILAFTLGWPLLRTGLFLVVGGLATQLATNLFGRAILQPVYRREYWAVLLITLSTPIVVFSISAYMAGVLLVICGGVRAAWDALFG